MENEYLNVPNKEQIAQLPRWAIVAFAARCARRVQPLFTLAWPDAPQKHIDVVDRAIEIAKKAAANRPRIAEIVFVGLGPELLCL